MVSIPYSGCFNVEATAMSYLYHVTPNLKSILDTRSIKLTSAVMDDVEHDINNGYPFYLSTTRTLAAFYTEDLYQKGNNRSGDILIIDPQKVKNIRGVSIRSVRYWSFNPRNARDEAEERILSNKSTLPLSILKSIVNLEDFRKVGKDPDLGRIMHLYTSSKKLGIPVEVFSNVKEFLKKNPTSFDVLKTYGKSDEKPQNFDFDYTTDRNNLLAMDILISGKKMKYSSLPRETSSYLIDLGSSRSIENTMLKLRALRNYISSNKRPSVESAYPRLAALGEKLGKLGVGISVDELAPFVYKRAKDLYEYNYGPNGVSL